MRHATCRRTMELGRRCVIRALLRFVVVLAVVLASLASASSSAAPLSEARWAARDLGTLGGRESYAAAINSKGQIVGWALTKKGRAHPVLWQGGRVRDLGTLGYPSAWADAITDSGEVVGGLLAVGGEDGDESAPRAFFWRNGSMTELWGEHDKFADEAAYSEATAVNDRGLVVGWAHADTASNSFASHAMSWSLPRGRTPHLLTGLDLSRKQDDSGWARDVNGQGQIVGETRRSYRDPLRAGLWANGKRTDLGTLSGRTASTAVAINDRGHVVGSSFNRAGANGELRTAIRAFLWQAGTMRDLGTLPGFPHSSAVALNERGQVIGWSAKRLGEIADLPKDPRAILWQNGKLIDLGTLGGASCIPFAINERGQVVGQSQNARGEWRAFVWSNGTMTALPTLGGTFSCALSVNDAGRIVGWSRTPSGAKHAVVWAPKR